LPDPCAECQFDIPDSAERCPHCALPGRFPNVRAAERERTVLEQRYQDARTDADRRGSSRGVNDFESALAVSVAIIARPLGDVERLAGSDKQGIATYDQLVEAELRLPDGKPWDSLRKKAGAALFTGYDDKIRFAALSLDGTGVANYGECWLELKSRLISYRASLFTANTATFMEAYGFDESQVRGHRAVWDERGKLAVAKVASAISAGTAAREYQGLLLRQGATSGADDFLEVHVYGPLTIRTVTKIVYSRSAAKQLQHRAIGRSRLRALREDLGRLGVGLEERP
jgi:hypothetical protein